MGLEKSLKVFGLVRSRVYHHGNKGGRENECKVVWYKEGTYFTGVVGQYPWEYGVLHEVIVGASGQLVEVHEILKVSDLTILQGNTRSHLI